MTREMKVKPGAEYLPKYDMADLEYIYGQLPHGKPRQRVHAAMLRKEGKSVEAIGTILKEKPQTIYDWLRRLADGGMSRIYDKPSPGRPCKITGDEKCGLELAICNGPKVYGYNRDNWTSGLLARHVGKITGKTYCKSGLLALVSQMGYSVRAPRPVPYNSATPEEQAEFREEAKREIDEYRQKGHHMCCYDACAVTDSPTAQRGIRTRGGTDTVGTNYSKESIQMLGVLGEDTLEVLFSTTYKSDDTIRMLEHVRTKYGKLYCILDNAGANKSGDVKRYVAGTNGDVVLKYILPHTPQLNPIELQWCVTKGGTGGAYHGDFDALQLCIKEALENGDIPVVQLQEYMRSGKLRKGPIKVEIICID